MQDTQAVRRPSSKIRVGILFGGKSAEHEISVLSAKNVIAALDKDRFEPVLIGIGTNGAWRQFAQNEPVPPRLDFSESRAPLPQAAGDGPNAASAPVPQPTGPAQALATVGTATGRDLDIIFPVLHGPLGEDGTVQGFLELAGIPYVGCGVLSSAINMDKDIMKRLLRDAGVPVTDFITLSAAGRPHADPHAIVQRFGLPVFVKPANMGSSIGISKVKSADGLLPAIDRALQYDRKILIEKAVAGDEVECAILGNDQPQSSVPGRIIPKAEFYTYEAKYHDEDNTVLEIPAKLPQATLKKAQAVALKAFKALDCEGMARVDMFVTKQGEVLVNELNTIPGFTKFSMYPQLWEASGVPYTRLITRLLELAMERHQQRQALATTVEKDN